MTVENSGDGVEQTYIKNDLDEYVPFDNIRGELILGSSKSHSRTSALRAVLPPEAEVYSEASGKYTGEMVHIIDLDGYVWMAHDYYGTCSYCDGFIDNRVGWTEKQLRRFYCFETVSDALTYIERTNDYGYHTTDLKSEARRVLTEVIQHE